MLRLRGGLIRQMSTAAPRTPKLANPSLLRSQCYVNGQWVDSSTGATFDVHDPATSQVIGQAPEMSIPEVQDAISHAKTAFKTFKKLSNRERANLLRKWGDLMRENQDDLAKILTWENGKPLPEAKGEVLVSAGNLDWFAEEAPRIYGDVIPGQTANVRITTLKQPVGVCGIITPWNFPSSMITRKVGAALAVGCTTVIKPAGATPYSALALAHLAHEAGIPQGVVNVVTAEHNVKEVGRELCENKNISKVTFTGSTPVGKTLMTQSASTMKKVSFELGGNAPFIVFEDADIDAAVEGAMASKFRGSGQTCICANRIYVHEDVYEEFLEKLTAKVNALKVGHGFDEGVTQGPLTNAASVDKVHRLVTDAVSKNGRLLVGGEKKTDLGGNFYAPTIIADVNQDMDISREEIFGPVAGIAKFSSEQEVIDKANSVDLGLAGYFYARDIGKINRVAEELEVGMVGVNTGLISQPALPFGGVKQSGFGREGSKYGLDDYMVIKAIATSLD